MMKNIALRRKFLLMIGSTVSEEYGLTPICGWIEGVFLMENKWLTQKEISDILSEILSDDHFATSLTSVNRALKSMEQFNLINKKGSRKIGYTYNLYMLSGIPIGIFQKVISVNMIFFDKLQNFKNQIAETDDKSLLNGIEIEIKLSQTFMKLYQKFLDEIKEGQ